MGKLEADTHTSRQTIGQDTPNLSRFEGDYDSKVSAHSISFEIIVCVQGKILDYLNVFSPTE